MIIISYARHIIFSCTHGEPNHFTFSEQRNDRERSVDKIYVFTGLEQRERVFFQCHDERKKIKKENESQRDEADVIICDGWNAHSDDPEAKASKFRRFLEQISSSVSSGLNESPTGISFREQQLRTK